MRRPAASLALEGVQVAWGGRARFDLERGFAEAFGLVEQGGGSWNAAADRWLLEVRLDPDSFLEMRLLGRSFEGFQGGSLRLQQAPVLRTAAGRAVALEGLSLVPGESGPRSLGLVDGAGQALFHLDYLHYWMHQQPDRVEVRNANLQVGAALALALGHPELEGTVAGVFGFESPADFAGVDAQPLGSCSDPVWPGTGGTVTDVAFTSLGTQAPSFLNSCVGTCTGSSPNARVFWAPNATLANAGTADVPWWEWISPSGATTPRPNEPPYGNHQHPLLIWNMYRIDGQGRLDQIGRSGLKHAYFTVNHDCGCPGGNILWAAPNSVHGVGCGDVYSSASNNESRRLGPRSEIVPVHAVWGRCGSLWDPQCEGIAKDHGIGVPAHRMLVRESDMAPSLNPGASFYLEAWYLVRDDVDIYNTMRNARGSATWTGSAWTNFVYEVGSHLSGPVIDRWVAAGTTQADAMSRELATAEGHARLAVRVTDAGGGLFRYDYAWMNFDFSRAVTQGSEPNLRVLSSRGFDRFSLPLSSSTGVSQAEAVDGAGLVAAWQWSRGGCTAAWTAPADTATLDWGGMMRFSLIASAAPVTVTARIRVHEPGTPSEFEIETLGPDAQSVYCDGFEQAPLVSLARNTSL
ncbi:MAG TPA: hypothetical protein PKZ76_00995 [Xanthomonadaceae bacterium]|nr:hypothetical protein [Xanthomonadaceae bacterium]